MLGYLDTLIAALTARDAAELDRLLAHPLARILTRDALAEVTAAATGSLRGAPLRVLQLRHQTAQLLGDRVGAEAPTAGEARRAVPPSLARTAGRRPAGARHQMELPLSA